MKKVSIVMVVALAVLAALTLQPKSPTASQLKLAQLTHRNEGAKPEFPGEAALWLENLRKTPNGENPALLNHRAIQQIEARQRLTGTNLPNFSFEDWGPGNFGGRIRGIVIHPTTPDKMVVGGVFGGMWKTEDGGLSWRNIDDFLPNLAIGSMLLDPDNAEVIYAGTGEGFFNVDAARGLGIYKSTDFGESWDLLPATMNSDFYYANRIARIPGSQTLLAATRTGLFRSTDDGANWSEVSGISTSSRGFVDLKLDPSDSTRLYATHYGGASATRFIMRSTNGGQTWTQLGAAEGLPTTDVGRMEIGIGTDGVIYVSAANNGSSTRGLYRSPAGGASFTKTASNTAFIERQGWYDLMIGVDPNDSDRVYVGAVEVFRTTDAGTTINKISEWNPSNLDVYVHSDIHNMIFHPTEADTFFVVCDGGVFKTTDGGDSWTELNNDLRLCQNYGIAVSPDGQGVIGGTQDNGSHLYFGNKAIWLEWSGGDGGYCAWDQQDPKYIYGSHPNGGIFGSSDGGLSTADLSPPNDSYAFIEPFTIDPNDGNRLIIVGNNVHLTENARMLGGATFTSSSPSIGALSSVTISPHDGAIAFVGSTGGLVARTDNLGAGATFSSVSSGLPGNGSVTWIAVDPHDATSNTVYITLSSYNSDRVWKTTNGGTSWTSIHANLANIPVLSISVDPTDADRLFIGTELGLWSSAGNTGGAYNWEQYNYGTSWTRVMQIHWGDDDTMYLGTHGRGTFRASRIPLSVAASDFTETLECDGDNFLDDGEEGTFDLTVTNTAGQPLGSVNISLASDQGTVGISGGQNLGTIAAGASATATFDVLLSDLAACLTEATFTATITHTGGNPITYTFTHSLGTDADIGSGTFSDGAEGATLLTDEVTIGNTRWMQVDTQANSGSQSWYSEDVANYADNALVSPWLTVGNGSTSLSFDLFYNYEGDATQYWDGAILELRTEGGEWFDIGNLSTVPYDGLLFNNNTNPSRPAWSGNQSTWRSAVVDLGTTYNGQKIQYRFRSICDTGANVAGGGIWLDNLAVTNVSWVTDLLCDNTTCTTCFGTLPEAIQAVLDSAGAGEWPATRSVLDYVGILNNICP